MTDGSGTTTYDYDRLGRLLRLRNGHGSEVRYEYDRAGRQTRITYPGGDSVVRSYDSSGRLTQIRDWLQNATLFSYNAESALSAITFPGGTDDRDTFSFDRAGKMTEVEFSHSSTTVGSLRYTRDANGQVVQSNVSGLPGPSVVNYAYDADNRLVTDGATAYQYDDADNPVRQGADSFTFNAASELVTGGATAYTIDADGQRTGQQLNGRQTGFRYDQAGNLVGVERDTPSGVVEHHYRHNGDGLRVSEAESADSARSLTWDESQPLPLLLDDGVRRYVYGPAGIAIAQLEGGVVTYLHHDQQGSVRRLTDRTGASVGAASYDAFGNTIAVTGQRSRLGYAGQLTDETGLIYLRARSYDPDSAQFLSRDPLEGLTGQPYAYAANNPLTYTDPSGLILGIPGTPSLGEIGSFVADNWRPIASATLDVTAIGVCAVPATAAACPFAIGINAAAQSTLVVTGEGSTGSKIAGVGMNLVLAQGAGLSFAAGELMQAANAPKWIQRAQTTTDVTLGTGLAAGQLRRGLC